MGYSRFSFRFGAVVLPALPAIANRQYAVALQPVVSDGVALDVSGAKTSLYLVIPRTPKGYKSGLGAMGISDHLSV
jgi:hypothetical protein